MTDRIFLSQMAFLGRHGVTEDERAEAQEIGVSLEVDLDLGPAGQSDELADTVDYADLFALCRDIVEERSYNLLEGIAEAIAADVLAGYPRVQLVRVEVTKPGVPIDGQLEAAGVSVERGRAGESAEGGV
jgi:7,8-dihydroneopterin aldolase/epimerase/oxygenase